ncbi:MAG: type I restriction endonuclease subunit R, partial [Polyangiaceae bacterium]|nr:type I restriction endonuclease subunit R [Polyangiaceae bacterium]
MNEAAVEEAAIEWLTELGYEYRYGPTLQPEGEGQERETFQDVVLKGRLETALRRLNPKLPADALEEAMRRVLRPESPSLIEANHAFHLLLTRGVEVQVRRGDELRGDIVHLVDFDKPDNNDWLVVNQFTVVENHNDRRPDVVVFLNGMPIAVIELKHPESEKASLASAFNQLETYKREIPSLFVTNELQVISDGVAGKVGSIT